MSATSSIIKVENNTDSEILQDISSSGRVRPWKEKKMQNEILSRIYKLLFVKTSNNYFLRKAERLENCSKNVLYKVEENGKKRLANAFFCRVRLCSVCQWRRSLKVASQMFDILTEISNDYGFINMTLSLSNVGLDNLGDEIDHLMHTWTKFTQKKIYKNVVKGYYRALEVKLNDRQDEFHPHYHVILVVNKSYFNNKNFTSQAKWRQAWKEAARVAYDPYVWCRKLNEKKILSAVPEFCKYTVKDGDYIFPNDLDLSEKLVEILDRDLSNRRFVAYGGIIKETAKRLQMEDVEAEDIDLVNVENEKKESPTVRVIAYTWMSGLSLESNYYRNKDLSNFYTNNRL